MSKWQRFITPLWTEYVGIFQGNQLKWGYLKIFVFGVRIAVIQRTKPW